MNPVFIKVDRGNGSLFGAYDVVAVVDTYPRPAFGRQVYVVWAQFGQWMGRGTQPAWFYSMYRLDKGGVDGWEFLADSNENFYSFEEALADFMWKIKG